MEFGVHLPNFGYGATPSPEHIRRVAQAAEQSGYTSIWASDHILVPAAYPRYGTLYETLVTLAWLAGQTERVRVGTSILVLPMRNAILVAKQAATLDRLTSGRLVLGVGAGWSEGEYANVGADFARRGQVLDESIAVMRNLFTSDPASFTGDVYRYENGLFDPKPTRPGGPPIWIGGNSTAALRRAAQLGDAWHADDVAPEVLAQQAQWLQAESARHGRRVTANVRLTVDLFAATGTRRNEQPSARSDGRDANDLGMRGSFDGMRAFARRYREAGATDLICQFEHDTPEQHEEFVRVFAREVVASLASGSA